MAKHHFEYLEVTPFSSIRELITMAAEESGDKVAYRFRRGQDIVDVTFRTLYDDTRHLGTALAQLGLDGLHVAMVGENSYRWITVYLTMLQSKGVFVPVDKDLPEADMIRVLKHSDTEAVFCSGKAARFLLANKEKLPKVRYFISLEAEEDDGNVLSYTKLRDRGADALRGGDRRYVDTEKTIDDVRMLVYTSGTTGMAKGVMLTEKNLCACAYHGLRISTIDGVGLSVLPYHHTYEAVAGILTEIHKRCTMCINENLMTIAKNLQTYKPDFVFLVPAIVEAFYKKIMTTAEESNKSLLLRMVARASFLSRKIGIKKVPAAFDTIIKMFGGNLKMIVCGGAPIRPELGKFFAALGINLVNGYGITECSPLVSVNRLDYNSFETAGYPLPCVEVRMDGADKDGIGEICVKGDTVMRGYYKQPSATAEVLIDGWFHTGDFGRFNEDGQLVITGRKKNLIVLENGKNIFPEEIEHYIQKIPYVQECVVYSLRNESGAEVALATEVFLSEEELKKRKITDPEQSLKTDINKNTLLLPAYKHITRIYIRPTEFEKTTTRKIRRSSCMFDPYAPKPSTDADDGQDA